MNIKKYLLLTLGIILFNNYCFADSSNYSIYIENVRKKLPEIKKNEISLQKINNDILRTRSIDDIFITMNALFQNIDDKQLSVDRFIDSSHFGTGINFQLQKKFSKTGTVLNFTSSFWDQKYTRDGIDLFDNVYEPMFSLTFSQPLLNNRFGLIDKFSMENAKIKYNIEKLRSTLSDEQIINYYSKKYFDFLANKEIVTLIDQSIKNTNILYKQIKDKYKKGLSDRDDVEKMVLLNSRLIEKRMDIENIKNKLFVEIESYLDNIDNKKNNDCSLFLNKYLGISNKMIKFEKSLFWQIFHENIKQLKKNLMISKNSALPSLDIIGNIKFDTYSNSGINTAFANGNDPEYFIGLEFSKTLGNHSNKSDIYGIELQIKDIENDILIFKKQYDENLKKILLDIKSSKKIYEIKQENVSSLEKIYKIQRDKFNTGRIPLSFLIDTENDIINEKIDEVFLKIKIIKYNFDYDLLIFNGESHE